ncbi:hypothetical protein PV10_03082 [Exophiala mesophila]|uniref:Uncharacterized protein n=1 Tax=Exophiala mesophila TaxID=212818 RepID=A0A0D2A8X5_EXOME|nr:uncharacterized protein PV10_03082 [Exophiala mesophila]KIV95423.1 hypothetical protein PV10_03082 [Exophiala mesophila]
MDAPPQPTIAAILQVETNDIAVFIVILAWSLLSLTPPNLINAGFELVFPSEDTIKDILQLSQLEFAPVLLEVFRCVTAPTIDYFKSLPLIDNELWGVYCLVVPLLM